MKIQKAPPYAFVACTFLSLFSPLFFPGVRLIPFASFLALSLHRYSLLPLLWWGIGAGLVSDMASIHYRLGANSLCYVLCIAILYPFRRQFFEEKPVPFLFLTFIVSSLATFFWGLLSLFKGSLVFSNFFFFLREVFLSSLIDTLCGFVFTFIPLKIYGVIKINRLKRRATAKEENE